MNLNKKPKFNLGKGDKINLKKDNGSKLANICMGVNWSAIEKKGFFGPKKVNVDLDASCTVFDENLKAIETIYFANKKSKSANNFILHSGDDLTGDLDGDDGLDNEVIQINLDNAPANANSIWFYLNSYSGQKFDEIPNVSIRVYEGSPTFVDNNFAQMNLNNDSSFANKKAMILGKIYKRNGEWKFEAIGQALPVQHIKDIITTITNSK